MTRTLAVVSVLAVCSATYAAESAQGDHLSADKRALAPLQEYVGGWRGVGQPKRGSNQGAWTETSDWSWQFAAGRARLVFDSPKAKYYRSGKLMPGEEESQFELVATRADESGEDRFTGKIDDAGQLVLLAADNERANTAAPARITLRTLADGNRLLVLYEKRSGERYSRLAEVGYTRAGVSLASGSGEPECVVTGGLGTIAVKHQGKTYYVCCTGCRDLFQDDPEGVLADYRQRKSDEREKAHAKK